tara:strand:- start:1626 stop:2051 length:426 start_codon:yes stop_codon:yes gene_type:complete
MKIQFEKIPEKINENNLKKFKNRNFKKNMLYSQEGIFCYEEPHFYKIYYTDCSMYNKDKLLNHNLIFENSKEKKIKTVLRPFHYKEVSIEIDSYKLRQNSNTELYIEKQNNTINDIYFITNEIDENNFSLKEDIHEFLSTF